MKPGLGEKSKRISSVRIHQHPAFLSTGGLALSYHGHTRYDGWGNLGSFTDAAGNTRTMLSDAAGRVTSMTDASGNTTYFTYDPNGNRLTSTDAAGKTTTFSYL